MPGHTEDTWYSEADNSDEWVCTFRALRASTLEPFCAANKHIQFLSDVVRSRPSNEKWNTRDDTDESGDHLWMGITLGTTQWKCQHADWSEMSLQPYSLSKAGKRKVVCAVVPLSSRGEARRFQFSVCSLSLFLTSKGYWSFMKRRLCPDRCFLMVSPVSVMLNMFFQPCGDGA